MLTTECLPQTLVGPVARSASSLIQPPPTSGIPLLRADLHKLPSKHFKGVPILSLLTLVNPKIKPTSRLNRSKEELREPQDRTVSDQALKECWRCRTLNHSLVLAPFQETVVGLVGTRSCPLHTAQWPISSSPECGPLPSCCCLNCVSHTQASLAVTSCDQLSASC